MGSSDKLAATFHGATTTELNRRRELKRLSKTELITCVVNLEALNARADHDLGEAIAHIATISAQLAHGTGQ